ncbi:fimbrial protein, partial [Pseudomonas salomonii]|uniref:fimbrial protein n=2 Tax=Pseudomonas TaxID=286 RepID=UPI0021801279
MKGFLGAFALLALTGVATTAQAVDCRVNGGAWQTGNPNLQVPVTVVLAADRTRITLEGARLECRFSPGSQSPSWRADYWATGNASGSAWTPGPRFSGERTGLRINGGFFNTPVQNGVRAATMPDDLRSYPIDITPYILMRNYPSNPFDVRIGDNLGLLRLTSSNNYDASRPQLSVTYIAANNFTVSPSSCTINNNNPIEINFGTVHQRAI